MSEFKGDYTKEQKANIAKNLSYARIHKGLTLMELSEMTGIPVGTLSVYELYGSISKRRLDLLGGTFSYPSSELSKSHHHFVKLVRWDDAYRRWRFKRGSRHDK